MRLSTVVAAFAAAITFGISAAAAEDADGITGLSKDISIEQARIGDIVARRGDMRVAAWVDRSDATYAVGDTLLLYVQPANDAYVTVLDVGTSGRVSVLFPNASQPHNRVDAHRVLRIGGEAGHRLRIEGPTGRNVLKVIASDKPLDLVAFSDTDASGPFRVLRADTVAIAARISARLARRTDAAIATRSTLIRIIARGKSGG